VFGFEGFLLVLVVVVFFPSEGAVMLFWPWEASGLNLCYSLASLLFVVLYLQKPQGAFVHCYGLFQKPFPSITLPARCWDVRCDLEAGSASVLPMARGSSVWVCLLQGAVYVARGWVKSC